MQNIQIKIRLTFIWSKMMRMHMAGSSQPQHFFAAECLFTDFEAMITDTMYKLAPQQA